MQHWKHWWNWHFIKSVIYLWLWNLFIHFYLLLLLLLCFSAVFSFLPFQTLLRVFDVCGHGYNNVVGSSFGRVHVLQPTKHNFQKMNFMLLFWEKEESSTGWWYLCLCYMHIYNSVFVGIKAFVCGRSWKKKSFSICEEKLQYKNKITKQQKEA